ncbi:Cdc14a, partial [Symbiodinium pilosum]
VHYFSIDQEFIYEPFFADFGPLNLGMVWRYCKALEAKLGDSNLADKRIVHYCSHDPKKRANAATLVCAFQVIVLGKPADEAYKPFQSVYPPFLPYRDATCGICTYSLTVLDCLKGLEKAIECGWFDWKQFDVESYEFFEK